jgi:hypothetical protein
MGNSDVEKAQRLVNSICDDFAELGYEKLPYPKVVCTANDIPELRTEEGKEGFEFRKFAYSPVSDKIYLESKYIESLGEELRINVYHELLHQVMNRKLLENGYFFAYFSCKRLASEWSERLMKIMLVKEAGVLCEHFADIVVESTLKKKHGLDRAHHLEPFKPQVVKAWTLGPIEGYLNSGTALFAIGGQDLITVHWLIEGAEVYGHALWGDKACENAFSKTSPRLYYQLQEIFHELDVDTPSQMIAERFRSLCDVAALEIDYDYIWRDELIGRHPEIEKVMCPYIIGSKLDRINEVLKSFLKEGRF